MSFKGLLKLLVSALMLALVLEVVDFKTLTHTFLSVPAWVLVMAILGYTFTQVISSVRWWLLARAGGISVPYPNALRALFIGMYANCFGLGTVGGDVLRGTLLAGVRGKGQRTAGITSAFADRALGLAVLSLIGVIATLFVKGHHMEPRFVYALSGVGSLIVIGWLLGPALVRALVPESWSIRRKVEQLTSVFGRDPKALLSVVCVAACFHLAQIVLQWCIARGMGIEVSFASMLVTVPFVNILSTLPISWNGVGVRERAYIFFFCPEIFTEEQAVALGAIWLLAVTCASAIGGVLAFMSGGLSKLEAEMPAGGETSAVSG